MSAIPEPPSRVENFNWFAATDWVVSNAETNAVTGTVTLTILAENEIPALLFFTWQSLALVGNVLVDPPFPTPRPRSSDR